MPGSLLSFNNMHVSLKWALLSYFPLDKCSILHGSYFGELSVIELTSNTHGLSNTRIKFTKLWDHLSLNGHSSCLQPLHTLGCEQEIQNQQWELYVIFLFWVIVFRCEVLDAANWTQIWEQPEWNLTVIPCASKLFPVKNVFDYATWK